MNEYIADSTAFKSKKDDPSLLAWFVKNTSGSKKLIIHQLLYLPAELLSGQPVQLSPPSDLEEGLRTGLQMDACSRALSPANRARL